MLERMWLKGNPCALLVRMQIGAATMENSMLVPQKIKSRTTIQSAIPHLGIFSEQKQKH